MHIHITYVSKMYAYAYKVHVHIHNTCSIIPSSGSLTFFFFEMGPPSWNSQPWRIWLPNLHRVFSKYKSIQQYNSSATVFLRFHEYMYKICLTINNLFPILKLLLRCQTLTFQMKKNEKIRSHTTTVLLYKN